tara:strand:+ start:32551 stop:33375 length:825 start_codon:yes stop_codon:yes gene_type:complete
MDLTPLYNQIFKLWFLIPFVIAAILLKSPWFKGVIGEFIVNVALRLTLPKAQYRLIKNVTLPTESGTTQIDHIVVSQYGIFVIETKNMKGWIFGSENQAMWTQKIFKHSTRFQNPLRQNYKHTKTLEKTLGINPQSMFSVIIFVGGSQFKTNMPPNVTYGMGCIKYIKSQSKELLTRKEVLEITEIIQQNRLNSGFSTNKAHVNHVKSIVAVKRVTQAHQPAQPVIDPKKTCPRCNSKMVLRTSKKGSNAGQQFWGCTSFPKCRAIANIHTQIP